MKRAYSTMAYHLTANPVPSGCAHPGSPSEDGSQSLQASVCAKNPNVLIVSRVRAPVKKYFYLWTCGNFST